MKLNVWHKLWLVITLLWIVYVVVSTYMTSEKSELTELEVTGLFIESLMLPIGLYLFGLIIAFFWWAFRGAKTPETDESLKAKSEAYSKWMKTKSDEDYQRYLELKEAREIDKKKRGIKNLYDK